MEDLQSQSESQRSGVNLSDILFILFKHKWKIVVSASVGIIAAAVAFFLWPPVYVSEAKLLVRYVVDKTGIDPAESTVNTRREIDGVINSEIEILTSWDLAVEVAKKLGPQRLLPRVGDAASVDAAALSIGQSLSALSTKGSNVIHISYHSADPELTVAVLNELIERYCKKHLEVHRSTGTFEFVSQQNLLLQGNLRNTEDLLKTKKAAADVMSLPDSIRNLDLEIVKTREELNAAEAELAEHRAVMKQLEDALAGTGTSKADTKEGDSKEREAKIPQADKGDVLRYQALVKSLVQLRDLEVVLLSKYTDENQLVRLNRAQIEDLEKQRRNLETKIPNLPEKIQDNGSQQNHPSDYSTERARLAGIEARAEILRARLRDVQARAAHLSSFAPEIYELERRKELEEASYKTSAASLEKARTDEALDPSKMPNISRVQNPSPALRSFKKIKMIILGLAGGGVAFGIGWVLLIGLILDRSIKRPLDVETGLGIPLMLSIPKISGNGSLLLNDRRGSSDSGRDRETTYTGELVAWGVGTFIRPFAAAIRDRLVLYFDRKKVIHNPKLVAVTGCSGGEGTSTIATALAAALSATGDGKVLLVDMNAGRAESHALLEGRPTCSLADVIEGGGSIPSAADNLYVMKAPPSGGTAQIIPKRFYDLVPRFKATDFDYIIFDMPPITQSTVALAMSGFMDKVLLVIEAEQTNREVAKRAYSELLASQADVSAVVNKTRSYTPRWFRDVQPGSIALPCPPVITQPNGVTLRRPLVAVHSILWIALFAASTLCFIVIFGHGFSNFGENARKEVDSLKAIFGLLPKAVPSVPPEMTAAK